jgi:hypothetical protein
MEIIVQIRDPGRGGNHARSNVREILRAKG